jgi:F-type H+-transporting ATPase subunit gamma
MASLKILNRKILALKNTRKITKAMKMIAFTRYRKAHKAMLDAKPFGTELGVLSYHLGLETDRKHPLTVTRPVKHILVLLFTSERGLCGGLNNNLLSATYKHLLTKQSRDVKFSIRNCGKKGSDYFRKKGMPLPMEIEAIHKKMTLELASILGKKVSEEFLSGKYDEVILTYNECKSIINLVPTISPLLPVVQSEAKEGAKSGSSFEIEPEAAEVQNSVIRELINFEIYQAYLSTAASEHASRMTAMDNATNNAGKLIDETVLTRNRIRQAAITRELTEIISGVESLKES